MINSANISLLFVCLSFGLFFKTSEAQIRISNEIQTSKVASKEGNSLYFIDYWATWCGPCINVKKYLSVLQEQFPDQLYIVSLSNESSEKVQNFLKKNPTDLAIAIDFNGENFTKNNVKSLPYGILLNASGRIVWEGHPANLKDTHITDFLRRNNSEISFDKIFQIQTPINVNMDLVYKPSTNFEMKLLSTEFQSFSSRQQGDFYEYKGKLKATLSELMQVPFHQINLPERHNKSYHVFFKKDSPEYKNAVSIILSALDLSFETDNSTGEAIIFDINSLKLWDTNQLNWKGNSNKYLIGNHQIEADNVSFNHVVYKLSNILEKPILIKGSSVLDLDSLYDWQFHYKFYNLMQVDLLDNYGIKVEKKIVDYPIINITKKTP